jgi:membrane protein required for colicin V production
VEAVDIVILAVLLIPGLVGLMYGFLNMIFSFISWVLAFGVAFKFSVYFSPLLAPLSESELVRNLLAFAGLFLISLVLLTLIGYFIVKLLGRVGLTAADRFLGFFLGIGLGGAIITVMIFLAGFTALPEAPWWRQSVLIEPFERVCTWGRQFLPENVSKYHNYDITLAGFRNGGIS